MRRTTVITGAVVLALGLGASGSAYAEPPGPTVPQVPKARAVQHGERTVETDHGTQIRTGQTGKVTAVSPGSLTVRSADGTTWTWSRTGNTHVTGHAVRVGDTVMVGGVRTGTTRTADRIRNPPPDFDAIRERLKTLRPNLPRNLPKGLPDVPTARPDAPTDRPDAPTARPGAPTPP